MMKKYDIFKDYLSLINSDSEILKDAFNELEMLLKDAKASHDRIEYLQSLATSATPKLSSIPQIHKSPLTNKQLTLIVTNGLVNALRNCDVSSSELIKFAHSIEGLNAFTDTLAGIPLAFLPTVAFQQGFQLLDVLGAQPPALGVVGDEG